MNNPNTPPAGYIAELVLAQLDRHHRELAERTITLPPTEWRVIEQEAHNA